MNRQQLNEGIATADLVIDEKTKQVSAIVRQLAFAGMAFIWLIVAGVGQPKAYDVSGWAVWSLIAFAAAIALDAGQYVATSASWLRLRRQLESELEALLPGVDEDTKVKSTVNKKANLLPWILFFTKVPVAGVGWILAGLAVASAAGMI